VGVLESSREYLPFNLGLPEKYLQDEWQLQIDEIAHFALKRSDYFADLLNTEILWADMNFDMPHLKNKSSWDNKLKIYLRNRDLLKAFVITLSNIRKKLDTYYLLDQQIIINNNSTTIRKLYLLTKNSIKNHKLEINEFFYEIFDQIDNVIEDLKAFEDITDIERLTLDIEYLIEEQETEHIIYVILNKLIKISWPAEQKDKELWLRVEEKLSRAFSIINDEKRRRELLNIQGLRKMLCELRFYNMILEEIKISKPKGKIREKLLQVQIYRDELSKQLNELKDAHSMQRRHILDKPKELFIKIARLISILRGENDPVQLCERLDIEFQEFNEAVRSKWNSEKNKIFSDFDNRSIKKPELVAKIHHLEEKLKTEELELSFEEWKNHQYEKAVKPLFIELLCST